ncbi:MAG: hypothetical protein KatS3mg125_0723 [Lysobacterales bacterium]|jgi:outer membrane receptor protein involved in Fe transport|nr:MAG: hypothetical protein KatS3mg125_0723 [Xanthomonadales bacterium]
MKPLKPNFLAIAIAVALIQGAPALAQQQQGASEESDAAELDKVTVTARRVREAEQEVPLSITAITEQQIEQRGMFDVRDVARYSAAFSFRSAFGRIGDRPVIRGMSNIQGQPNASFFIDGIFVPGSISGYNLDNLERVEVIRGPQSALFGRRTFSGAVNFVTRAPTDEFRSKVSVSGGNDNYGEVRSYISGPLVEGLLGAEVNASHREIGSRFYNNQTQRRDVGGEKTTTVGGVLALRTDTVDARLRYHYLRNNDEHAAIFRQGSDLNNCFLPTLTGQNIGPFPAADSRRRGYFCGVARLRPERFAINTDQFALAGVPAGLFREASRASLSFDWTLPNNWLFSSISAYNDTELYSAIDQDYSGIRGFNGAFETFDKTRTYDLSQEFRITTDTARDVYAMLGVYYYRETQGPGYTGSLSGFNIPPANNRTPPIANPTRPDDKTENYALFGLLEWRFSPQWRATFEARYAEDKILTAGTRSTVLTVGGQPRTFTRTYRLSETFTNFLPRVTLSYFPSDEWMWYGLVSKGNKPGGFNLDVQNPVLTEQARNELIAAGFESFDEEEAWNYEIGFKSDWPDQRLRFNTALFYIDWTNQQLTETRPVSRVDGQLFITSFTTNLGKSRVQGLEFETIWLPWEGWRINANYAYLDAKIKRYFSQDQADLFGDPSAAGNRLPRVPRHAFNVGALYEGIFGGGWSWFAGADVFYESSRYDQIHNLAETGSSTRLDLRIGLRPNDRLSLTAWVRNATDDDTVEDILRYVDPARFINVPGIPGGPARQVTNVRDFALTAPEPRSYGLTVTWQY